MADKCKFCSDKGVFLRGEDWICEFHWKAFGFDLDLKKEKMTHDPVNSPSHYTEGGIETIDFIEAKKLNFNTGNAVKYIARAGKKDPAKKVEDLRKAIWYLEREINNHAG